MGCRGALDARDEVQKRPTKAPKRACVALLSQCGQRKLRDDNPNKTPHLWGFV